MEEVRSYWQVASISHFCTIFGKQFKLPIFEPEELEQAFILDIPAASTTSTSTNNNNNNNHEDQESPVPVELARDYQFQPQAQLQQQQTEEQELHLLVRLAIALLKPHFNSKISHANWENYLRRIVDSNWVELEHHPSPFRVPLISQDGVELTKNLTFNELPLSDKIDLFYALCDYRLWCEDAVDALKDYTLEELRLESIGKDSQGYEYWYFSGTRLFRENKELSQDIILRKKRIKELEYRLIELEKTRIFREQEEKRKVEHERARQLVVEAREARIAAKKLQEQEAIKKKKQATPILPPRTGLRERRSSATSNNNDSQQTRTPTTRSKQSKQQPEQQQQPKTTRNLAKNSKHNDQHQDKIESPDIPKKSPEEESKDELERLKITLEDRAEAWRIECESLEEWERFATKFEKTKSTNEKYLSAYVNGDLLQNIRAIYAKRASEVRRKEKELLLSLASRRVSSRIICKRAQEEEEERQAQVHEAEMRRKKTEAETRLRVELEREMRERRNRVVVNGGTSSTCSEDGEDYSGRYNLRQQQQQQQNHHHHLNSDEFDGIIHPDSLSEFYEALELVIDTVRTSKHAWPFVDPVPETVPGYYDLITEPMDLRKLRTKIEFRGYKSLIELEKDFQILVNNCEKFNGPRNVYTKMVYKLWKSFRKNVRLYLQRDLFMDEYETFVYPPPPKEEPPEPKAPTPEPIIADSPPIKRSKLEKQGDEVVIQNGIHQGNNNLDMNSLPVEKIIEVNGIQENSETVLEKKNKLTIVLPKMTIIQKSTSNSEPLKTSQQSTTHSRSSTEYINTNSYIIPANFVASKPLILSRPISISTPPSQSSSHQTPPPPQSLHQQQLSRAAETQTQSQSKSQPHLPQTIFVEQPPDPIGDEIIIDSYNVPCPDDNPFLSPQDARPT